MALYAGSRSISGRRLTPGAGSAAGSAAAGCPSERGGGPASEEQEPVPSMSTDERPSLRRRASR
eukprot:2335603-Rhodomonas_salina.1